MTTNQCKCGCGNPLPIRKSRNGLHKGWTQQYLSGHNKRTTGCVKVNRYNYVHLGDWPKGFGGDYEARIIASVTLEKPLPSGSIVFHLDGVPTNTKNLVICQNRSYVSLLIARRAAYLACGEPSFRRCKYCHEYDDMANLIKSGRAHMHKLCQRKRKANG